MLTLLTLPGEIISPKKSGTGLNADQQRALDRGMDLLGKAIDKIVPGPNVIGPTMKVAKEAVEESRKGLASNPFKGKTFQEIEKILTDRGFRKVGVDPANGKGSYFHPESGRKYYLDKGGEYREGRELPHVDVHRMRDGLNLEKEGKHRYPLGDHLIEPKK